jgi:hypothetical protein
MSYINIVTLWMAAGADANCTHLDLLKQALDLADTAFRVQLLFAAATGVRAGELHALRWSMLT